MVLHSFRKVIKVPSLFQLSGVHFNLSSKLALKNGL
jgi:hypothetical protein